jgi:zinc protease
MSALRPRWCVTPRLIYWVAAAMIAIPMTAGARETPPPLGTPRAFDLPKKSDWTLPNGLKVTRVPFGSVPKATIYCTISTGRVADGTHPGLAELATSLMREGAGSRDAAALANAAAEMGGALAIGASVNEVSVSLDVLSEEAPAAIALIADVLLRPRLPASELPRLKTDLIRNLAVERSQAQGIAGEAFAQLLWGHGPYGRPLPTEAEVKAIRAEHIRTFVRREFGARRTHLYIAGQFDANAVDTAIRRAFGGWRAGPEPHTLSPEGIPRRIVRLIDRPGAAQSTIMMGRPAPVVTAPGFTALSVANNLLGGGLLARLNQNLREAKGYTYGVSSDLAPYPTLSAWSLATDVNTPDTAASLHEIVGELRRLRETAPSTEELRLIQNYRVGHFLLSASSRAALLSQLAFIDQQGLPEDWLSGYVARSYAVTPEDTQAAARQVLDPDTMTIVVVGDLGKIKASILALPELQGATFQ